jgi:cytochrome b561
MTAEAIGSVVGYSIFAIAFFGAVGIALLLKAILKMIWRAVRPQPPEPVRRPAVAEPEPHSLPPPLPWTSWIP